MQITSKMKIAFLTFSAWSFILASVATSKSETPLCAKIFRLDSFTTKRRGPTEIEVTFMPLTSGICRYGENNRFVIDLKRVVEISEIDVNSSLFDQGIRVFLLLRSGSNGSTQRTGTCYFVVSETTTNNSYRNIRCNGLSNNNQGRIYADMLEISSQNDTAIIRPGGHANPSWFILRSLSSRTVCFPPGHYADQSLDPHKKSYDVDDVVKYACTSSEMRMEGQNNRTCKKDGLWSGNTPKCYFIDGEHTATLNKQCNIEREFKVLRFPFSIETTVARIDILFTNRIRRQADWNYFNPTVSVEGSQVSWLIDERFSENSVGYVVNGTRSIPCRNCTVLVIMKIDKAMMMYGKPSQVKLHTNGEVNTKDNENKRRNCPPPDEYHAMSDNYKSSNFNYKVQKAEIMQKPCEDGYHAIDTQMRCLDTGIWSGKLPQCELISCERPRNVNNLIWNYVQPNKFHKIRFTCASGFHKKDESIDIADCNPTSVTWRPITECVTGNKQALIIGGIFAILISLAVLGGLIVLYRRKAKRNGRRKLLEKSGLGNSNPSLTRHLHGPRRSSFKNDHIYDDIELQKTTNVPMLFEKVRQMITSTPKSLIQVQKENSCTISNLWIFAGIVKHLTLTYFKQSHLENATFPNTSSIVLNHPTNSLP